MESRHRAEAGIASSGTGYARRCDKARAPAARPRTTTACLQQHGLERKRQLAARQSARVHLGQRLMVAEGRGAVLPGSEPRQGHEHLIVVVFADLQ